MQNSANINACSGQNQTGAARSSVYIGILVFAGLVAAYWALSDFEWKGSTQLHTKMELLATVMALVVGLMAIVNFYSQRLVLGLSLIHI